MSRGQSQDNIRDYWIVWCGLRCVGRGCNGSQKQVLWTFAKASYGSGIYSFPNDKGKTIFGLTRVSGATEQRERVAGLVGVMNHQPLKSQNAWVR